MRYQDLRPFIIARSSIAQALSESISNTNEDQDTDRRGFDFAILFGKNFFSSVEWALGFRYDRDSTEFQDTGFVTNTNRYMFIGELTYKLRTDVLSKHFYFATLGTGIGRSETTIADSEATGLAFLIPSIRIGRTLYTTSSFQLFLEGIFESYSTKEKIVGGTEQTSNITFGRIGLGIRF